MISEKNLFIALKNRINSISEALSKDKLYIDSKLRDTFVKRQRSQKTAKLRDTKVYHPDYYRYRLTKFGYSNILHNYYLTGTLHSTLQFYYSKGNLFYEASSQANYLKYLVEGTLNNKFFPLVKEAFEFSDDEKQILLDFLRTIIINEYHG